MYFVIMSRDRDMLHNTGKAVDRIHMVWACALDDVNELYQREVVPMHRLGLEVYTLTILREPPNPFDIALRQREKRELDEAQPLAFPWALLRDIPLDPQGGEGA